MKRIILYAIILFVVLQIPVNRMDISDLEPVEAICVEKDGQLYVIKTDTGDTGIGETVEDALQSMKTFSEKIIYFDTAQYLLVGENCKEAVEDMAQYLKQKVKVCVWNGVGELQDAAQYMKSHQIGIRLKECFSEIELPEIPELFEQKNVESKGREETCEN